MKKLLYSLVICGCWLALSAPAWAGLLFVPTTYGLSPRSVGLGNAMTAVGEDVSMAYYNPGALSTFPTSQVGLGYLYAAPRLNGGPNGDEVEFDTDNKLVLVGLGLDLSGLFNFKHGLGFGLNAAIDNNLKSFMAFNERREDNGQFIRYGLSSATINMGLGVEIIDQLHLGLGGYVMIKGENTLVAETDMAGNTQQEEIAVDAEPVIAPVVGLYAPINKMITVGAAYHGKGVAEFSSIDAATKALVSESTLTQLNLKMAFKDAYVPQNVSLGAAVRPLKWLLVAVDASWYNWGDYDDEVSEGDVVRSDADFKTVDTYVPRLGLEFEPYEKLYARVGYFFEATPFRDPGYGNAVVLDNDRHAISLGIAHDMDYLPFMKHPVGIGATYFYHHLATQTVENVEGQEFESSGSVQGIVGSLTLRF